MKIHILYPFKDSAWGGANQFLKALKNYFIAQDVYTEDEDRADVLLFNSSPSALISLLKKVYCLKKIKSDLIVINRIDGPVYLIRGKDLQIDKSFYYFNKAVCDGTVFQSRWSRDNNYKQGMERNLFETVILNSPNSNIFNKDNKAPFASNRKVKLIATSWSSNMKKGFGVYDWLDKNLDFEKYEFTFVGNSPIEFDNIRIKSPMTSDELAIELKQHDIFITASEKDPCSNSLIEAMHCSLPAMALSDGGHPEIVSHGGEVFKEVCEIKELLEKITLSYDDYQRNISLQDIEKTGSQYLEFMRSIYDYNKSNVNRKIFTYSDYLKVKSSILFSKIISTIKVK